MPPENGFIMQNNKLLLKNCRLYNNETLDIYIEGKFIVKIAKNINAIPNTIDLQRLLVIPALIDPHTHIRDLAQSYKGDWKTGEMAALSGGHSLIFDMPNTIPPTTTPENFYLKLNKAKMSRIKYRINIGASNDNIDDIKKILEKENETIGAIKVFLASSSDNEVLKVENLEKVFGLAKEYGKVVIVHAEMQDCIRKWSNEIKGKSIYNHHLIRNRECVIKGAKKVIEIAKKVGNKLYLAHISTKEEVELLKENPMVFAEVTPHHLFLNSEDVKRVGIVAKVNPPIRRVEDNIALLNGIKEKIIDVIATDHAPHSKEEKFQDYVKSPSGFGGLETKLPLLITAAKKKMISYEDIVRCTSQNPAKIFGLKKHGEIKEGFYADLCILDDNEKFVINSQNFYSKSKYSPFDGMEVFGKVKYTIVNGKILFGG